MFKSVFLVNTLHARTRVWAISLPVLYINVLYINAPPPPPAPSPRICVHAFRTT